MSTYAIGDIHGCLAELKELLRLIDFSPAKDKIWLVGDLVNRGPNSLETLRFIRSLEDSAIAVLGNHDLHLLALEHRPRWVLKFPHLLPIFLAPDCKELLAWLRKKPLLHHDEKLGYTMIHAGIPPQWDFHLANLCAKELEGVLQGPQHIDFFYHMYGAKPDLWNDSLVGWDRLRIITNCLTRMRFCDLNGRLNLSCKAAFGEQPPELLPWFKVPGRKIHKIKIIFGHWAALAGQTDEPNIYALDTGCVWGNKLTAMRLEDEKLFSVASHAHRNNSQKTESC